VSAPANQVTTEPIYGLEDVPKPFPRAFGLGLGLVFGPLDPASRRRLHTIARELDRRGRPANEALSPEAQRPPVSLALGSRLVREWKGVVETVEVVEGGFIWKGKTYPNLSAAAFAITGTKWSGPRFFGVAQQTGRSPAAVAKLRHSAEASPDRSNIEGTLA
jgi:hypothetical protein